jgi:O-antigen/teichoic acid export membrane protein
MSGVLLSSNFVERTLYIQNRPDLAVRFSLVFLTVLAILLFVFARRGLLNGFTVFLIAALAWICAGGFVRREFLGRDTGESFLRVEPRYWSEHWNYARWVLVTALVFQLTTQAFYWLVAGILSVKEVASLRAIYLLVGPIDQVMIAMSLLFLPLMAFRFAAKQDERLILLWKGYGLAALLITGSFATFICVVGTPIIHILYAGKFDDVTGVLKTLAFLPLTMSIGNGANAALKSIERPQAVFWGYVAGGSATFILGMPMVKYFGLQGAAYGMLISAAVYTVTLLTELLLAIHPKINGVRTFSVSKVISQA